MTTLSGAALKGATLDAIEEKFFARRDLYARTRRTEEKTIDGRRVVRFAWSPACACAPTCMLGSREERPDGTPHQYQPLPVTDEVIYRHLTAKEVTNYPATIGAYSLNDHENVNWICWDVDAHAETEIDRIEAEVTAQQTMTLLAHTAHKEGLPFYVEQTARGLHGWTFIKTTATTAYRAGHALVKVARDSYPDQIASTVEVFPKQTQCAAGRFGNHVKLPWGLAPNGVRTWFVDPRRAFARLGKGSWGDQFQNGGLLDWDWADPSRVEKLASLYVPEPRKIIPLNMQAIRDAQTREGVEVGPPCVANLMNARLSAGENAGRNNALFYLVVKLRRGGLTDIDALLPIIEWWNSQQEPPLDQREVLRTVHQAFSSRFSHGCEDERMGYYCERSRCPIAAAQQARDQVNHVAYGDQERGFRETEHEIKKMQRSRLHM